MNEIIIDYKNRLIVTTDNTGSIGEKVNDTIQVSYDVVSYFTLRNAIIDNLAQNTKLLSFTFANFNGNDAYNKIIKGINKVFDEIGYKIPYTSSTESNYIMKESAFSVTVIGEKQQYINTRYKKYAVVGKPLIGIEIINQKDDIVTLKEFEYLLNHKDISLIIPVGSKGINHRSKILLDKKFVSDKIDLNKSAGPSSCILIEYKKLNDIDKEIIKKVTVLELQK